MGKVKTEDGPEEVLDSFLADFRKTRDGLVYLGIDPGASGAVGVICERYHCAFSIPTVQVNRGKVKTKKGKPAKTTVPAYQDILRLFWKIDRAIPPTDIRVCLEQPPPTLGPGRTRSEVVLNRHYAMWPLFLLSLHWSVEEVAPSKWKADMGLRGKDKEDSRQMAAKMFPRADVQGDEGDKAESLLIAEWKRRLDNGGL